MKKRLNKNFIVIMLLALALLACGKIPEGIVDVKIVNYSVLGITAPSNFSYSQTDSTIVTSVQIANTETVSAVWCKITSLDGTLTKMSQLIMYDDGNLNLNGDKNKGDGIYSAKFVMGKLTPIGKYQIEYFVEDKIRQAPDNLIKVGTHIFTFDNGQNNLPSVITAVSLPPSVSVNADFVVAIKVSDPNGLHDIDQAFFRLYTPTGAKVDPGNGFDYFLLADDGKTSDDGDQIAGDGIYSAKKSFKTGTPTGTWKFEFQARDKNKNLSNMITHFMAVN